MKDLDPTVKESLTAQTPVKQEPVAKLTSFHGGKITFLNENQEYLRQGTLFYAAPVQQIDLTPYEITALIRDGAAGGGWQGFAQRVIAADREKNK